MDPSAAAQRKKADPSVLGFEEPDEDVGEEVERQGAAEGDESDFDHRAGKIRGCGGMARDCCGARGLPHSVAGLRGTGTTAGTTNDSTGAFAPVFTSTFVVSSDELDGVSWFRRADFYDPEEGPVTVDCRPEGLAHSLWGTDIYTDDSSICTAAAHAGLITLEEGGEVTFAFTEGPDVYPASARNGVTSHEGSDWPEGFEFVEPS